jgi:CheY-like chemotaxis protein
LNSLQKQATPRRSILYIGSNAASLALVEHLVLSHANLSLLCATTGCRGTTLATLNVPSVILMDLYLSGISASEVLRLLRNDHRTAQVPIIAFSVDAHPTQPASRTGFAAYISPPVVIDKLMDAIEASLTSA